METNQKAINPGDYRQMERFVKTNRRSLLFDITTKFNEGKPDPLNKRTIQYNLRKHNYRRSVAKKKRVIKRGNRKKRLLWCRGREYGL